MATSKQGGLAAIDDIVGDAIAELARGGHAGSRILTQREVEAGDERTVLCERDAGRCQSRCRSMPKPMPVVAKASAESLKRALCGPLWPRTTEVAESNNQEMLAGVDLTQRVYFKGRGTLRQAESS